MPSEVTLKTCFISAPFGADLGGLPRVLDKLNINWEWAKGRSVTSDSLLGDLRKIIRMVDLVVAVLTNLPDDANTLFEVGVAVGLGKPVLLLLSNDCELPFNLEPFPHVRVSLRDEKAIELHLDLLIRTIRSKQGPFRYSSSGQVPVNPVRTDDEDKLGDRVSANRQSGHQLEVEIVDLIEQAGGQVLLQNPDTPGFTPDLLVWFPNRDLELFNPAVIELKTYPLTRAMLGKIEDQLTTYLRNTGVRTAMIVAPGIEAEEPKGFRGNPALNVFLIDLERFRQLLRTGQLANHLRQERNRAAHGLR